MRRVEGNPASVPETTPEELVDHAPLDQPVEAEFRVGALSLGWDPSTAQVVVEAYPLADPDDDLDLDPDDAGEPVEMMTLRLPVGTARAFAARTLEVVGAGRPLSPLCGAPMDPEGHVCAVPGDSW